MSYLNTQTFLKIEQNLVAQPIVLTVALKVLKTAHKKVMTSVRIG